jgi:hypothetical protein
VQSVTILRSLWRHRLPVGVVALLAVLIGWTLTYRLSYPPQRRSYEVGVATASILVDTPKSQVVEVNPKGSDGLGARATVLASLMVDGEIRAAIARRVGLPPQRIVASSQGPDAATEVPALDARAYGYTTSVALTSDLTTLPIIRVRSQAPDVQQAIELANNVVAGLGDYLDSKAIDETIADTRRLRVRPLGTAQGHQATRGPSPIIGLLVAIAVFLAGCAMILAITALVRGWRAAAARERDIPDLGGPVEAISEDEMLEQHGWFVRRYGSASKARAS